MKNFSTGAALQQFSFCCTMNLGVCPRIRDAVIPAVFKPESMIRKSFFGAGLDSGLKLAGITIDTIRPIIGQARNQNENCWLRCQKVEHSVAGFLPTLQIPHP